MSTRRCVIFVSFVLFAVGPCFICASTSNHKFLNKPAATKSGAVTAESVMKSLTELTISDQIINTFFHASVDSLTPIPAYSTVIEDKSFIEISKIGIPINLNSFNNSQAFSNPSSADDYMQAQQFSLLVNHIAYNATVSNLECAYWNILHSAVALADSKNDPAFVSAYRTAYDYLYTNVSILNPLTNQTTYTIQLSNTYQTYLTLLAAYDDAVVASYIAQSLLTGDQWIGQDSYYLGKVGNAQQELSSVSREVEDAIGVLNTKGDSLSATVLTNAQTMFTTSTIRSTTSIPTASYSNSANANISDICSSSSSSFHLVLAQPDDWATNNDDYSNVTISSSYIQNTLSDSYKAWVANGGFGGFHFQNGSGSDFYAVEATWLSVSFEYVLLQLQRPWLFDLLLSSGSWSLPDELAGSVSQGVANSAVGTLPSYPSHLIIVKNLNITGNWTEKDILYINNQIAATVASGSAASRDSDTVFGFGPFTISRIGKTVNTSQTAADTSSTATATFDGISITTPAATAQIVGYVQKIVPFLPNLDNSSTTTTTTTTTTNPHTSTSAPSASTSSAIASTTTTMTNSLSVSGTSSPVLNAAWTLLLSPLLTVLAHFILSVQLD